MVEILVLLGIAVVAAIVMYAVRRRSSDQIQKIMARHQPESKLVSKAELVEGRNRMPVALALRDRSIHYENPDLEAELELERIDEVEYSDELATGMDINNGGRVLRLRSHGQAFEFLLEPRAAEQWAAILPSHRMDEPGSVGIRTAV